MSTTYPLPVQTLACSNIGQLDYMADVWKCHVDVQTYARSNIGSWPLNGCCRWICMIIRSQKILRKTMYREWERESERERERERERETDLSLKDWHCLSMCPPHTHFSTFQHVGHDWVRVSLSLCLSISHTHAHTHTHTHTHDRPKIFLGSWKIKYLSPIIERNILTGKRNDSMLNLHIRRR